MRRPFYYIAALLPESILPYLIRKTGKKLCCPYYHMVSDNNEQHINQLYKYRNVVQFEEDLQFFLRHFKAIRWDEAIHYNGSEPAVLITFDDGFRCFYETAAPLLKKYQIPSGCFINSGFADNKDILFRCSYSLEKNGYNARAYLQENKPYMTRAQIKELYAQGVAIGAHSINHPHFTDISEDEQIRQISESLRYVQDECGVKERLFSFPFSQEGATEKTLQWTEKNCDLVMGTLNLQEGAHGLLNRIWMEGYHISAKNIIIGEYLREWFRQLR